MPQPLGHLWTLSVEGQFYVGWALLVAWLLPRGPKVMIAATLSLIAASAAAPFVAWTPFGPAQLDLLLDRSPHTAAPRRCQGSR